MTSETDALLQAIEQKINPLVQAFETLKDQKTKLLEDKIDYLNQKITLVEQQYATVINNIANRMQTVEKFLQQVIDAGKQQQKPPASPISFPPEKSPARNKTLEG